MPYLRVLLLDTDLERLRVIYRTLAKATWRTWIFHAGDMLMLVREAVVIIERLARQEGTPLGPNDGLAP